MLWGRSQFPLCAASTTEVAQPHTPDVKDRLPQNPASRGETTAAPAHEQASIHRTTLWCLIRSQAGMAGNIPQRPDQGVRGKWRR